MYDEDLRRFDVRTVMADYNNRVAALGPPGAAH